MSKAILRYCDDIGEAIHTFGSDIEDFLENIQFQHSCSFELFQIGEIVKRLSSDLTSRYSEIEWSNIARLRDIISHKYESIDLQVVWDIMVGDILKLKKECEIILTELRSV